MAGPSRDANGAPTRPVHPAVQRALNVEQAYARVPSVSKAHIRSQGSLTCIEISASIRSDVCLEERAHTQSFILDASGQLQFTTSLRAQAANIKLTTTSASGDLTVNFRSTTEKSSGPSRTLEVHSRDGGMLCEIDVSDEHAEYLRGDAFGDPAWSDDERLLVYVAEQHAPYHKDKQKPPEAWEDYPHFGEVLYEARKPGLYAIDLRTPKQASVHAITRIESLNDPACTQPTVLSFHSDNGSYEIFATARYLLPDGRRLGQVWCTNRPSSIVKIRGHISKSNHLMEVVSPADKACHRPTIFPANVKSQRKLLYFGQRRAGPHNSSAQLLCQDVSSCAEQPPTTLVDHCHELADDEPNGLYISDDARPFPLVIREQHYACLSTQWRCRTCLVLVSLADGGVQLVRDAADSADVSWSILATDKADTIVATRSCIANELCAELVLGRLGTEPSSELSVQWLRSFAPASCMLDNPADCHMQIIRLAKYAPTEALFVSPVPITKLRAMSAENKPPFVLYPHGGPNSAYSTAYSARIHGMVAAGFCVALVNYPGSIGFGDKAIGDLAKACGELDVQATYAVLEHCVKEGLASTTKGKRFVAGGSHGGFLSAHLSSRWPASFDAAILSNPVIDLISCFSTSDIPDWSMAQFDTRYDFLAPPAFVPEQDIEKLRAASPSSHLVKLLQQHREPVMPPSLMLLGENDLRVPGNQGRAWVYALRAHREKVKMFVWPNCGHRIETPEGQIRSYQATLEWLVEHARFS